MLLPNDVSRSSKSQLDVKNHLRYGGTIERGQKVCRYSQVSVWPIKACNEIQMLDIIFIKADSHMGSTIMGHFCD